MQGVVIAAMKEEHIDEVMVVEHQSFKIPWSRSAFQEEVGKNKFARYIIAGVNGRIVGYAGMWKVFDEGHITNVAVHPEFRRNGVGSLLVEGLLEIAKSEGIMHLTLEVRKSNLPAQALYSRYDFQVEGMRKSYYADNGEDAVIMWKRNGNVDS